MTFSFGTKLETWSKQKTFFLLILLIGVGVHILFNLLYIYVLYDLYEKYDLSFQVIAETLILLIPCIFIFFLRLFSQKKYRVSQPNCCRLYDFYFSNMPLCHHYNFFCCASNAERRKNSGVNWRVSTCKDRT